MYHLAFVWVSLLFWFISLSYKNTSVSISIDAITIACSAYILWMLFSVIFHPVIETWAIYTYRLSVLPFTILSTYYLLHKRDLRFAFFALVVVGLFDALVTLYQAFYLGVSADGFFANRNNNAAFLYILMLPLLSMLVFEKLRMMNKVVLMSITAVFLLCVLQVSSRGAYISLFVAVVLLYLYAIYRKKYASLLVVSTLMVSVILVNSMITEVEFRTGVDSHARWLLLISAFDMLKDSSWYGIGNGMFHLIYPQYKNPDERSLGLFLHNDYLQVFLELGIPGLIFFISIFAIVFFYFRRFLTEQFTSSDFGYIFGMHLAILAVMIHSLVTFNLYLVSILLVLGFYIGLILKCDRICTEAKTKSYVIPLSKWNIPIVTIVIILAVTPMLLKGYADGINDDFLSKELVNSPFEEDYRIYSQLWEMDPFRYAYPMSMAWTGIAMSRKSDYEARLEMFKTAMELIDEAKKLNPYAADVYLVEAQILSGFNDVAGRNWRPDAIKSLQTALAINPGFLPVRSMLADFLKRSGNAVDALAILVDGLVYMHNFGHKVYYEHGASLAQEVGDSYSYNRFSRLLEGEDANKLRKFDEMIEEYNRNKSKG